ncbi:TetR family transcriptional regulator [Kitasatospora sp. NPDC089913]|uniref:TetR family transcriptional regulator n=1 Tax=Streptomycetaceae TaxID=2062 RepID=UPI001E413D99|nr:TetR family transcriptional regulator [Streptomyces sp. TLI_053]
MSEKEEQDQPMNDGQPKPAMREALVAAAFELFLERGFEQTTIDDIVSLAGVGRRSFFRYFPAKEDVVFPDHERGLAEMTEFLESGSGEEDPVRHACDAARLVLRMYAEQPSFSVQRYRLTRKVPGLRTYELSVVWRYEHTLAHYLRGRFAGRPEGPLRADVVAAAVVSAHNHALRTWLRSGGESDWVTEVDRAMAFVTDTWGERPAGGAPAADGDGPGEQDDVVVLVASRRAPLWRMVQGIESALGDPRRVPQE